ncbi:hypothetical protein N482_22780 [Pseudoalteromonas luteoviolacea NCIMB 1942]|uniref:Uncharacterized protein n=1 Tax=Pseudoalteromonas luteoviolacea NCIMB 1942 TaxID=1365253 RepID=A0A167HDU3_9GAMM|nr:hypothetical protein N482_22780 [Pseudoalteromonas luteoviolacea NCIMB 1942]
MGLLKIGSTYGCACTEVLRIKRAIIAENMLIFFLCTIVQEFEVIISNLIETACLSQSKIDETRKE